ncbi:zinc-dependent alcohol dehydrogenase family protein [Arsenicicoccus piscis]|uniref:Alcohol dehydrogenase n=1 Tax=Arsenicicoccus piscis TaxID=673954 RepID=A0ABQ6HJS9_9MICO|nr:zinc-dependent alcohol dehydrogenase family protein [Arsenicicoccus piscis]MCH8627304.1 zinc-dependent alcohol dehydrogenase family protein [Arsenicicoccus piscis]GMA18703.1 alcohol dehydrogenase [Arsenicicoccus piscis]
MRAVVYDGYGATPQVRDVAAPTCPPRGVVVDVLATGVCRSDWHAWRGEDPVDLPHVPGHELVGVVAQVGEQVRRWHVGDRVTVPFVCGCGRCEWCLAGEPQVCPDQTQPGFTGPGSFAAQVALHEADLNLVALPDAISDVTGAALGCRFATAYRALVTHARLARGQWLAVYGLGGVGLSALLIGVALGARVVAVDVSVAALERAVALGAAATVSSAETSDAAAAVRSITGGGAHATIDAIGSPTVAAACVWSLRRRGRHVQAGLLLGDDATPPIPMDRVIAEELEIYGTHGLAAADYPAMLELVASGAVPLDRLVGRVVGLDDAPAALMAMSDPASSGRSITVVTPRS